MKTALVIASLVLATSGAFAADAEKSKTETVDHSKNILTGTKKTVKKTEVKNKDGAGNDADSTVTETTKVKTDGSVEKKTEVEASAKKKAH